MCESAGGRRSVLVMDEGGVAAVDDVAAEAGVALGDQLGDAGAWDYASELRADGVHLPVLGDLLLTDVLGGAVAALDPTLPGANVPAQAKMGLGAASQLLVILVDGLGLEPLTSHYGHAPTLRSLRATTLEAFTVAPSTTAAAITAFATGARPGATRMVGYSVAHGSGVMNLLAFENGPDPQQWQPVAPLFERLAAVGVESAVVSPPTFAGSGLTRAALRGARHVGAVTLEDRCAAALRELRAGTPVVYLYWSDIDHEGHVTGVGSSEWVRALEDFDRGIGSLLRRLPTGVRAVLTADHGMVNVTRGDLADLASTPALAAGVRVIAGETRCVHVHCLPGAAPAVMERWKEELEGRAWIIPADSLAPVMGAGPGLSQVGDFVAFMKGRWGVVDSRIQSPGSIGLVGVHGSLTAEEMRIPVIPLT